METKVILNSLNEVLSSLEVSDEFKHLDTHDKFFNDSCLVVGASYKLHRIIEALELIDKYSVK